MLAREAVFAAERPERLVVRVDRTDPSKNIVRGFLAFGLLLAEHPEWHGRVSLLALLDPSRQKVPEYVEYLAAVEREAAAVNERFGRDGWLPVDLRVADDFAALGRRVQAVRRAARERRVRRHSTSWPRRRRSSTTAAAC